MEDKLLAEIAQIKTLLNRQGKALEELQAINQENRDDRRHLELRLVAASSFSLATSIKNAR